MKVNVEIDMTPDEARRLMGLPDVADFQKKMMDQLEERMRAGLDASDPEAMMKAWMPLMPGFEQFQRFLWDAASKAASGSETRKSSSAKELR